MSELHAKEYKRFEDIKHIRDDGGEYWFARELSTELEYTEWRNFSKVVNKAKLACKNSGFDIDDHFVEVNKMVSIGSGTSRNVLDYELSRYACYLIVQNGDPRKDAYVKQKLNLCANILYTRTGRPKSRLPALIFAYSLMR